MNIFFDVAYLYYLPHFTPVLDELKAQNTKLNVVFHREPPEPIKTRLSSTAEIHVINEADLASFYNAQEANWIIFGNASCIPDKLKGTCKTAMIMHGLGPKSAYYNGSASPIQYRFVETESRKARLEALYPDKTFVKTGYTKLDPIINDPSIKLDLVKLGLDPDKPTLLYSPTFYPSTIENFPRDWPQDFADYNILLKPHYLSLIKPVYQKQRELLQHWATYDNVYLAKESEQSLVPFMATADLMISETSSALFEFIALDKPVIICHFLKLRWSYRGLLKFRLKERLSDDYQLFNSMGANIEHYHQLKSAVESNIQSHTLYQKTRQEITQQVVGAVDGQSSKRVADYLLNH